MTTRPRRRTLPEDLKDIFKRIRYLEGVNTALTSGNIFDTYTQCVLADPTLLHFWPCDDAGGGIVDIFGGGSMTEIASGGWPHYGDPGPFDALPEQTAVSNGGVAGAARFSVGVSLPGGATPFTLQGWLYQNDAAIGGVVWEDWAGGAGAAKALLISNAPFPITYTHGSGLTVTGGGLIFQTWTHIRMDYDGATLRLLQDGVLLNTDTGAGSGTQSNNHFLNNNNTGGTGFAPFQGRAAMWSLHDGVAAVCAPVGGAGGGSSADEFTVFTAGGDGSTYWGYPTIATWVNGA